MQPTWLTFVYRVPSEPSRKRAYVWRHLKQMGAVYLQQAVCVLPYRDALEQDLQRLAEKIHEMEGEATILATASPEPGWDDRVIAEFNASRDAEYAEVIENVDHFEAEVARESSLGKFTFAELEDLESDLDKIVRWLGRVRARDYFRAPRAPEAQTRVQGAQARMEAFTEEVYRHEGLSRGEL